MKKVVSYFFCIMIVLGIIFIPTNAFAENTKDIEMIEKTSEEYIVYVEGMMDKEFQYALSDKEDLSIDSMELDYKQSAKDEEDNNVAILTGTEKYLYVKEGTELTILELNYDEALSEDDLSNIENSKIDTEVITIEEKNETTGRVKHIETVGGLDIKEDGNYEYVITKIPSANYDELKSIVEKINSSYESADTYSKIKLIKEYKNILDKIVKDANSNNLWQEVSNLNIKQPSDAETGDEYAVLLKKKITDKELYDIKFLISTKEVEETEIEEVEIVNKTTTKLPLTYDQTIILLSILAVIIISIIVVVIAKKKVADKEGK